MRVTSHDFFVYLCEKYYDKILKYCYNMLYFKYDKAEECAQNTFLKAYENLDKLSSHNNPAGWLYKTAHNFVMQVKVKMHKDNNKLVEYTDTILLIKYDYELINDIDEDINISDTEIQEYVSIILSQLNQKNIDLYNMFYVERMSTKEIAFTLKITPNCCRVRLFRLRKTIEDIVKKMFNK